MILIEQEATKKLIKENVRTYSSQQVREAWQKQTNLAHLSLILDDQEYHALPQKTWEEIMKQSDTRSYKYIPEFRDCDDFAFLFKGELTRVALNGCGLVINFGGKHAYNVALVYDPDMVLKDTPDSDPLSFKFIEPQDDQWIILDSRPCYSTNGPGIVII